MKVIGICGSPRAGGNSEILLDTALDACAGEGALVEKILLRDMDIAPCEGCVECPDECITGDDTWKTIDGLLDADGIIIVSPVYLGSPPSNLVAFQNRSCYLSQRGYPLANKVGATIAVGAGPHGGQEFVNLHNIIWFLKNKMIVVGEARSNFFGIAGRAMEAGDIKNDDAAMDGARKMGARTVEVIKLYGES